MEKLNANEYNPFYQPYIDAVLAQNKNILELLDYAEKIAVDRLQYLTKSQQEFRYDEGKWSIKEILQHLIDAEQIFCYRALRFARFDKTDLAGFDENHYVAHSFCEAKDFDELLAEFKAVRKCSKMLFKNFSADILKNQGLANGNNMSVRAIGYVIAGHQLHHLDVIKERYLGV